MLKLKKFHQEFRAEAVHRKALAKEKKGKPTEKDGENSVIGRFRTKGERSKHYTMPFAQAQSRVEQQPSQFDKPESSQQPPAGDGLDDLLGVTEEEIPPWVKMFLRQFTKGFFNLASLAVQHAADRQRLSAFTIDYTRRAISPGLPPYPHDMVKGIAHRIFGEHMVNIEDDGTKQWATNGPVSGDDEFAVRAEPRFLSAAERKRRAHHSDTNERCLVKCLIAVYRHRDAARYKRIKEADERMEKDWMRLAEGVANGQAVDRTLLETHFKSFAAGFTDTLQTGGQRHGPLVGRLASQVLRRCGSIRPNG